MNKYVPSDELSGELQDELEGEDRDAPSGATAVFALTVSLIAAIFFVAKLVF